MHQCQTLTQILMDESTFEFYKETAAVVWRKMVSFLQTFFFPGVVLPGGTHLFFLTFFDSYWNRRTMLVQFEPKNINRKNKNDERTRSSSNPSKSLLSNLLRHWFAFFRKKEHVVHFWNLQKCDIPIKRKRRYLSMQQFFIFQHLFVLPPTTKNGCMQMKSSSRESEIYM